MLLVEDITLIQTRIASLRIYESLTALSYLYTPMIRDFYENYNIEREYI